MQKIAASLAVSARAVNRSSIGLPAHGTVGPFVVYTDTRGLATPLDVPANLRYTPAFSLAGPISPEPGLAGNAFDFDAYRNSVSVDGFTFVKANSPAAFLSLVLFPPSDFI